MNNKHAYLVGGCALGGVILLSIVAFSILPSVMATSYDSKSNSALSTEEVLVEEAAPEAEKKPAADHLPTPKPLKGVYMTSWIAGTPSLRSNVIKLIEDTEINAVVIDIKDDTGRISYEVEDPYLIEVGGSDGRISDIRDLIKELHEKNIYVIGRVAVFQDPYLVKAWPDQAVKRASDGGVWKDRKGISWMDAGSKEVWNYVIAIAKDAYNVGFDEINFDYVRFPSDGNMSDISFSLSGGKEKSEVIRSFFQYVHEQLGDTDIVTSADLFGMVTTVTDDMNIGQILENALPYFDYIMPMVYPSHYPDTWNGFANPDDYPYETIQVAMGAAVDRANELKGATSTPSDIRARVSKDQLRPWLQDFDYGGDYDIAEVKAQIKATNDVGLDSWILWSPSNKYTQGALQAE